jgi:hypothetical protein
MLEYLELFAVTLTARESPFTKMGNSPPNKDRRVEMAMLQQASVENHVHYLVKGARNAQRHADNFLVTVKDC